MSKGGGGSTETSKSEPWEALQPYLKKTYAEAEGMYDTYSPQYYSGTTQAGFSPDQLTAQAGIRDFATRGAPTIMNPALSAYQYGTGSSILDVANNPYIQGMAQGAVSDVMAGLAPEMANIRSGAIQSGGYGGSRQGIAEGAALAGAADAATRAAADIYGQAYGQGLDAQGRTLGMTGDILQAGFSPYGALSASGAEQQAREQALIQDAMSKYEFEQNLPYNRLSQFTGALSGTQGLLGNSGVSTVPGQSGTSKAMDLATTAYMLSKLSDIRLKTNIKKIGKLRDGINIYKWDWKEGAKELGADMSHTIGVLAQEVKEVIPEAIIKHDGYYRVNYGML